MMGSDGMYVIPAINLKSLDYVRAIHVCNYTQSYKFSTYFIETDICQSGRREAIKNRPEGSQYVVKIEK